MAYTIKMGSFAKLENSTAQPTVTSWAEYSVVFKEGADYSAPVLAISEDFSTLYGYNYAYMLGRYYWITDIKAVRTGYCTVSLKVDVLATYKTAIGSADLYVLRSSTTADGNIRDNFYPIKSSSTKYRQVQPGNNYPNPPFTVPPSFSYGIIVLYVAGIDATTGTTMWQMSPAVFKSLISELYTAINGIQLDDVISQVVQFFGGNPQSLISRAMWFPFPFNGDNYMPIKIGGWTSSQYGLVITDPVMSMPDCTFTLNKHPQAATRGAYLNLAPYTSYQLGIPGCGEAYLDGSKLTSSSSITIKRDMDAFTGQMIAKVYAGSSNQCLSVMTGQCGIPIALASESDGGKILSGTTGAIGAGIAAAASGGASAIAGAVSSGINAAIDAVNSSGASTNVGGGAAAIMNVGCWLDTICYDITDSDNSQNGRPLCQIRKPSVLGGYMVVSDGYVSINGPLPEQQEVKSFLERGFFYE